MEFSQFCTFLKVHNLYSPNIFIFTIKYTIFYIINALYDINYINNYKNFTFYYYSMYKPTYSKVT